MSIITAERAREIVLKYNEAGQKVVFTNGCFDILHVGHTRLLRKAKSFGDCLIVGLNSDASIKRYKGEKRPIVPQHERAEMLLNLTTVCYVVIFEEDEPASIISIIKPHVLVKGADWTHYVSGRDVVEANGGEVKLIELEPGQSTTNIIEKVKEAYK